eukprot:TRINITY_DN17786_c0_g1_i1.p1 TRINITY_DN17786_c0_g1~~TRINITY_DN17786_c0_g1_i1.p1  ORF type:complete len:582 (+),score=118.40 TRINITY_DN17786_c0_g1_i1:80-1747(+)
MDAAGRLQRSLYRTLWRKLLRIDKAATAVAQQRGADAGDLRRRQLLPLWKQHAARLPPPAAGAGLQPAELAGSVWVMNSASGVLRVQLSLHNVPPPETASGPAALARSWPAGDEARACMPTRVLELQAGDTATADQPQQQPQSWTVVVARTLDNDHGHLPDGEPAFWWRPTAPDGARVRTAMLAPPGTPNPRWLPARVVALPGTLQLAAGGPRGQRTFLPDCPTDWRAVLRDAFRGAAADGGALQRAFALSRVAGERAAAAEQWAAAEPAWRAAVEGLVNEMAAKGDDARAQMHAKRTLHQLCEHWRTHPDPECAAALQTAVQLAFAPGLAREARSCVEACDTVLALDRDCAEAWNLKAVGMWFCGELDLALWCWAQCLTREPRHFGALHGAMRTQHALGDPAGELRCARALLGRYPRDTLARRRAKELGRGEQKGAQPQGGACPASSADGSPDATWMGSSGSPEGTTEVGSRRWRSPVSPASAAAAAAAAAAPVPTAAVVAPTPGQPELQPPAGGTPEPTPAAAAAPQGADGQLADQSAAGPGVSPCPSAHFSR